MYKSFYSLSDNPFKKEIETKDLYQSENLKEKDFHGFKKPDIDDHVLISIEFEGDNLARNPHFHCFKTSENKMRITYIYAHENIIQIKGAYF